MAQRRAKRVKATRRILVAFVAPSVRLTGYLENLSTRGLLLRCSHNVEPGTVGRVGMEMDQEMIRIVAKVKNCVSGVGIALEFIRTGSRDRDLLNRLLSRIEKNL